MLAPTTEIAQKATLLEHLWNDEFVEGFQAMAQWSRDHVPFPGAAFRQLVELLVRENALMSGSIRVGYREIALERARGEVLVAMAQRDNVVPAGATEPALSLVGDPARRDAAAAAGRPRHVRDRQVGLQAHDAATDRMDHGPQRRTPRRRGGMMEIRRIEPGDRAALERFLDEIPDADRTFLKEDVADPDVVAAWVLPGDARSIALDGGDVVGYVAVIPLHGWSRHVGEVRIVVDPDHRGRGVGQALARHAVLEALELGVAKLVVEVIADQQALIAMFVALGFEPEALLIDHVRDRSGELRDLLVLAHTVAEQWASMAAAGIVESR